MRGSGDHIDRKSFAERREVRDLLRPLLVDGAWTPESFDETLEALRARKSQSLRQLVGFFREGRIGDEMAALEVLGRLADPDDDDFLAQVVADADAPESARVACALVLLGHDAPQRIQAGDISKLVLRWQARFLAEEPSLRPSLMRLYHGAPREERARWAALQDAELGDPEGRAAVFEMLLEVEEDEELRLYLLDALVREPHPCVRAALRRLSPRSPAERDRVTGALAGVAAEGDPDEVPEGWTARVGFTDGTGSFPLRFDFRLPERRPRSAVFVLNLETGAREALALTGFEVDRYDRLEGEASTDDEESRGLIYPVPIPLALGLLVAAERSDLREARVPPLDFLQTRRLIDPLADLRPRVPEARSSRLGEVSRRETASLLDHPGYAGWFYDAGDHFLDDLRLDVLSTCRPGRCPSDELISRAARRLELGHEPQRVVRMLRHNVLVHLAAGEESEASLADACARAILAGGFVSDALVRRMVRDSLHPGHYFLTPVPDVPERHDLATLVIDGERVPRSKVFLVDLAWILTRATEVWNSRVPCSQRPHNDQLQEGVLEAASRGARLIQRWLTRLMSDEEIRARTLGFGSFGHELRETYRSALDATAFPAPPWDLDRGFLLDMLVDASEALVFRVCLSSCPGRCLVEPKRSGRALLEPGTFPAGRDNEVLVRTWPGPFMHRPSAKHEAQLAHFVARSNPQLSSEPEHPRKRNTEPFRCPLCGETRPATTRARGRLVAHEGQDEPQPVCRRCQRRYRRDDAFRAEIKTRLGRLVY